MICIVRQYGILSCGILVRTVRISGTEQPHIVPAVRCQSAVGYIQIVIVGILVIDYIWSFA
ncbi:hypothetical protein D3C75_799040 [compost metagenome]